VYGDVPRLSKLLEEIDLGFYFADFEADSDEMGISQYENAINSTGINWVIIGEESGRNAQRVAHEAIKGLIQQCNNANVPVFLKQVWSARTGKLTKLPVFSGSKWAQFPQSKQKGRSA
jgi:protein gp37